MPDAIPALARLLIDSAARHADRTAVEDPAAGRAATYAELRARSAEVRDRLAAHGGQAGDRVGILAPKSIGVVGAIFGTLEAGAAYVPVDAAAPAARGAEILKDCGVRLLVTTEPLLGDLAASGAEVHPSRIEDLGDGLLLAEVGEPGRAPSSASPPADIAYLLYTSGSTGRPKGVVHTHASALSFVNWCSEAFRPAEEDRFSSHAPFHFDLSIFDLFVPIKHGAAIVLIGEDAGKQPARLGALIAERRISVWYSTPSILRLLVEYGRLERVDVSDLRLVLFAGEVFPLKHLRALEALWPHPRYANLYGPTETNVCTWYEIPAEIPADRKDPFPIGWPCSGDRTMVADEEGRPAGYGEAGELLVAGGSVMQGYWNLREHTAAAFHAAEDGTRWYRTGDMVRETPSEGYLFLGRRDRMVKRRGYRVELGEIEAALHRHSRVAEAAVMAFPDEEHGVTIRAFLSLSNGERPSLIEMKTYCSGQLPAYMIPDRFEYLERLPKTSTDKIDYQRLSESH